MIIDEAIMFTDRKDIDKCFSNEFWKEWNTIFDYVFFKLGWYNINNDGIYVIIIIKVIGFFL
jgi:hypothetical protein